MKFVSWNVNGLRACVTKGFLDVFKEMDADFFCLQETKLQEGQITLDLPGYHQFWCSAQKKGYSGTAIFTRHQPLSVSYGLGIEELDTEGRLITLEYPEFYLVTCYTPNAQRGLARIEHRLKWEDAFRQYLMKLDSLKPVILCGDLNVAHKEIDLKNPGSNRGNAGFSDEERQAFTDLLGSGFTDTFRHLYPNQTGAYSWWSYMFNARQNNAGWRIDYFVISDRLKNAIHDATIHPEVMGSDHCPVGLDLNITCNGGIHIPTPDFSNTDSEQKAGGNPTGQGHLWRNISAIALAVAALFSGIFLLDPKLRQSSSDTTEPATQTAPPITDLIQAVVDRTADPEIGIEFGYENPNLIHQYLISETDQWYLGCYDPYTSSSPILPIPSDPTSYLQIAFHPSFKFHSLDCPEVTIQTDDPNHQFQTFYYYINGHIAGCFILGFEDEAVDLLINIHYQDLSTQIHHTTPAKPAVPQLYTQIQIYNDRVELLIDPGDTLFRIPTHFIWNDQITKLHKVFSVDFNDAGYKPNFFVTIEFALDDDHPDGFTKDEAPSIGFYTYGVLEDYASSTLPLADPNALPPEYSVRGSYYYNDKDLIAGMLLCGYVATPMTLNFTISQMPDYNLIPLDIYPNYSIMTTYELAYTLNRSQNLSSLATKDPASLSYTLEDFISTEAVQHLLSREDCVDAMLDTYSASSSRTTIQLLLNHPAFQSIMTEEQHKRYIALSAPMDD